MIAIAQIILHILRN